MNKLVCSLIAAIGFGSLPSANAETSAAAPAGAAFTAHHAAAHRTVARKKYGHHRHHRHHRHPHHLGIRK